MGKNVMLISQALSGGGVERVVANLSKALQNEYNVIIVTYTSSDNEYEYAGIRENLGLQGTSLFSKIICALKRIVSVRKLKEKYDIDYAVSFLPQTDYANVLSKRKNEYTIIEISNTMSSIYASRTKALFRKFILNKADAIITISSGIKNDLINKLKIKHDMIRVIHNSCNIEEIQEFCTANKEINVAMPKRYICTAGSFRREKGHWHLIKAFSSIKNDIPDVDLVILGEGGYRSRYDELIQALGIQERVFLPGFINPPYSIIANSEVFVLSSIDEGFGNVIIEAMACGVPVVASDCNYGPREIIAPPITGICCDSSHQYEVYPYGILTPFFGHESIDVTTEISDEEECMGKALLMLLNNTTLRNQLINNTKEYVQRYRNERFGQLWREVFREISKPTDIKEG